MNLNGTTLPGLEAAELDAEQAIGLPSRELLATLGLNVLGGLVSASTTVAADASVLGLANVSLS